MIKDNHITRMKTELEINGRNVTVCWTIIRDILEPEGKHIEETEINSVEPPVDIDDETLLRMCEEQEYDKY